MPTAPNRSRLLAGGLLALALALQAFLYRGVLDLELLGHDSYPFLAQGAADSAEDVGRILTEEAMGGRYPGGVFYRPVTTLSFTLDHLRQGIEPRGYHATGLAILLATTVVLFLLARRLIGGVLGPAVALFTQVLHVAHLETVPVAARRVETLFVLFALAALYVAARPGPLGRGRALGAGLLALLAVGAKESGVLVVPWIAAVAWAQWPPDRPGRLRGAAAAALPAAGLVAAFLVARHLVLGELGGHDDTSPLGLLATPAILWEVVEAQAVPQPPFGVERVGAGWIAFGLALILAAVAPLAASRPECVAARRKAALPLAMLLLLAMLSAYSWRYSPWHVASTLPAYALLLGLGARAAWAARRGGRFARATAAASALGLAGLGAIEVSTSPLTRSYPEWEHLSAAMAQGLTTARTAAAQVEPGEARDVGWMPYSIQRWPGRAGIDAVGVSNYTLEAYLELVLPDRTFLVLAIEPGGLVEPLPGRRVLGMRPGDLTVRPRGAPNGTAPEGAGAPGLPDAGADGESP